MLPSSRSRATRHKPETHEPRNRATGLIPERIDGATRVPPGRDDSPILRGETITWDNVVYYDFENTHAVGAEQWKYVERFPAGPHELYNLAADPREEFNLYGQPLQREIQHQLKTRMPTFFTRHADPRHDLWRGGGSKTKPITADQFSQFRP